MNDDGTWSKCRRCGYWSVASDLCIMCRSDMQAAGRREAREAFAQVDAEHTDPISVATSDLVAGLADAGLTADRIGQVLR